VAQPMLAAEARELPKHRTQEKDGTYDYVERRGDREGWSKAWLHGAPRKVGLREAVRRYGAERLMKSLAAWALHAASEHDEATREERLMATRFSAAMGAFKDF